MIDLFLLHDKNEDFFPESWLGFEGNNLNELIKELLQEILKNKHKSKYWLCQEISRNINMCNNGIWNYLNNKKYVLLPIISELLNIWKNECNKTDDDLNSFKKKILSSIQEIKVNNSSSIKLKAIKELDEQLSFILGSHAADGMISVHLTFSSNNIKLLYEIKQKLETLLNEKIENKFYFDNYKKMHNFGISLNNTTNKKISEFLISYSYILNRDIRFKREYRWKLVDGYEGAVSILKKHIYEIFGINLTIKRDESKAWKIEIKNKVLIRYLHKIFDFPYGYKSRIVDEPNLIKESNLKNRTAFLRGFFTFDGGINRDKSIKLTTYSEPIFESLKNILNVNHIKFTSCKVNRGGFQIQNSKNLKEWLIVFERNTEKWKKLNAIINGNHTFVDNKSSFMEILSQIYPKLPKCRFSIGELIESSKELNVYDINELSIYLIKKYNIKITNLTLMRNIEILERCNVLKRIKTKEIFIRNTGNMSGTNGAFSKNVFTYNPNIKEWRLPY